ncbi:mucin-5AC-like [Lucilia cuprina]|uniref:mucin-5AC-like n=1 Tax=Lucilia cuprina TaxID=7375 RepID=UPI001F068480|nr:mucin-5AC-like [Lucilia cuprina]
MFLQVLQNTSSRVGHLGSDLSPLNLEQVKNSNSKQRKHPNRLNRKRRAQADVQRDKDSNSSSIKQQETNGMIQTSMKTNLTNKSHAASEKQQQLDTKTTTTKLTKVTTSVANTKKLQTTLAPLTTSTFVNSEEPRTEKTPTRTRIRIHANIKVSNATSYPQTTASTISSTTTTTKTPSAAKVTILPMTATSQLSSMTTTTLRSMDRTTSLPTTTISATTAATINSKSKNLTTKPNINLNTENTNVLTQEVALREEIALREEASLKNLVTATSTTPLPLTTTFKSATKTDSSSSMTQNTYINLNTEDIQEPSQEFLLPNLREEQVPFRKSLDKEDNNREEKKNLENSSKESIQQQQLTKYLETSIFGRNTTTPRSPLSKTTISYSKAINPTAKSYPNQDIKTATGTNHSNNADSGKTLYRYSISTTTPARTTTPSHGSSITTIPTHLPETTTDTSRISNSAPKSSFKFNPENVWKPKQEILLKNSPKTAPHFPHSPALEYYDKEQFEAFKNFYLKPKITKFFEKFPSNADIKPYDPVKNTYRKSLTSLESFAASTTTPSELFKVKSDFVNSDDHSDFLKQFEDEKFKKQFFKEFFKNIQMPPDSFIERPMRYLSDKEFATQDNMDMVTILENLPHFNMFNLENYMPTNVKDNSKDFNYYMPYFGMEIPDD